MSREPRRFPFSLEKTVWTQGDPNIEIGKDHPKGDLGEFSNRFRVLSDDLTWNNSSNLISSLQMSPYLFLKLLNPLKCFKSPFSVGYVLGVDSMLPHKISGWHRVSPFLTSSETGSLWCSQTKCSSLEKKRGFSRRCGWARSTVSPQQFEASVSAKAKNSFILMDCQILWLCCYSKLLLSVPIVISALEKDFWFPPMAVVSRSKETTTCNNH